MEAFQYAWLGLRKAGVHIDRKQRTLEWCLFEAVRGRELEFLAKATCIGIMLDERNGRLLIKYSAASRALDVRVGCLALMRDTGGTARDVAAAVHTAMTRFCTRHVRHPGINTSKGRSEPNQAAEDHIRNHIEMLTADGVPNKQTGRPRHRCVVILK